ncbi:hypothetical protein VTN31DRAFT_5567 [Thermomyces dupontii]|uniref:uncharacterized protein n=1 Tax=Talaromyces thermophilus TaxID=28565 RepID=UPI003741EE68
MVVYIIRPPLGGGDSLLTPEALLSSILAVAGERDREEDGILTRDQAVGLLDHVHLLPVPDVTAVAQAVGQISDEILPYDGDRLDESSRPLEQQGKQQQVLLILEGLDILTENLIRSSNSLRGCAVIVPILRTLTYLTRSYADRLAVLVVNGVGLLSVDSSSSLSYSTAAPGSASFTSSSSSSLQRDTRSADAGSAGGASLLQSVFGGLVVRQPLLSRTLDYGVDVHLLVSIRGDGHDASSKATAAVEVVKDRVGGFLGEWCFV